MKTKQTFLKIAIVWLLVTLTSTIGLWLTRSEDLASQSEFADQPNVFWYIMLHTGMILSFFILNAVLGHKKWLYGLVAFASGFTLMFDVLQYNFPHLVSTALIFTTASLSIIVYEKKHKTFYTVLCGALALVFLGSFLKLVNLSVYAIESIIEWIFATILILRIKKEL